MAEPKERGEVRVRVWLSKEAAAPPQRAALAVRGTSSAVVDIVRGKVSKKKRRFQEYACVVYICGCACICVF